MQLGGNHASLRCKKPQNAFKWKIIVSPSENEDHHDFHGKLQTWSHKKTLRSSSVTGDHTKAKLQLQQVLPPGQQ